LNKFFCFFSPLIFFASYGEFSYCLPVGFCDDKRLLCHYITHAKTSLIIVETLKSILEFDNEILSRFNSAIPFSTFPVQPVLFFEGKGFSYFDQGILKSKYFAFRSPGSIYSSIPFDHTMGIHWHSPTHGILSILKNNFYVVYDISLDNGNMTLLIDETLKGLHAIFPFVFNESIFYVLESLTKSKIVVQNNTGTRKVLFQTDQSRIVFFTFFNSESGIFSLYDCNDTVAQTVLFHFYRFNYSYETMAFEKTYCCTVQFPFEILESLSTKNLFPWCLQPIEYLGKLYVLDYINEQLRPREVK
jgi:hypothetical protein